jgi:cobalt-zinc-cadmium efflux system outer membrane protein
MIALRSCRSRGVRNLLRHWWRIKNPGAHLFASKFCAVALTVLFAGCQTYQPLPLPEQASLERDVDALRATLPDPQAVNLDDGLSMNEAAILAVHANPELLARRKQLGVAQAQLYSAGLLPDPQLGLGIDYPGNDDPSLVNALTASLGIDLLALMTRGAGLDAETAATEQVRLQVLWQEWQVSQQARLLVVKDRSESKKLDLLLNALKNFEARESVSSQALTQGNVTIANAGPDLTALLDAGSQLFELRDQHSRTHHELYALLGLEPSAVVEFSDLPPAPQAMAADANQLSEVVQKTRPDLLALQYGYASQEARVRKTVLSAFPALGIGFTSARDTGNIRTLGFGVNLTLPVFSGNRGELKIQRATREQLWAEYQARLAQDYSVISRLLEEQVLLEERREFLNDKLPDLEAMAGQASMAYATRDLDALVFLNLEMTLITKRMELIDVEQSLWEISIALDTLTARPGVE